MIGIAALPAAWKAIGIAAILFVLAGAGLWLYLAGRSDGGAACDAAQAKAVAEQVKKDQATSAVEISKRDKRIADVEAAKTTITKVIHDAPVTNGCGPAVGAALDWLQQRSGSGAPTP